jgi:hypothetical protein
MTSQLELALELSAAHAATHAALGAKVDWYGPLDGEYYRIGRKGVIGVMGDYVHTFVHPDDIVRGSRDAIRLYQRLLDEGRRVIFPVYYLNFRSIIGIKKLGSTLLGVDEDNFFHYELKAIMPREQRKELLRGKEGT